ncbi:MAG: 5-(carboxyamino)imidazole ribonucleotide synthase [Saprospiraceae bacterium]|nr:5-(carboxyamino)imidazole ribonucleotide synthase [Saprospiraceae bacterium]
MFDLIVSANKLRQKIGILGGGQLGKMLCQAGSQLGLNISVLEKDYSFPAADVCRQFVCGDINNYDDVYNFGIDKDVITIEIENVNIEALEALEKVGIKVYPQPAILKIIKDKGIQKLFYEGSGFPSAEFTIFKDASSLLSSVTAGDITVPFVQKTRTEGYDGKGVHIVRNKEDLNNLLAGPCIAEQIVDLSKEIAVIVARNQSGDICSFPPVEMQFHSTANLVEYLFCPSDITTEQNEIAASLAIEVAEHMGIIGLLAVEMFIDTNGSILINEVAPRPHTSGHHTIEACITSQYEMHLRAILDLPLGSSKLISPAVMVNLLGEASYSGPVIYEGIESCLDIEGVYPHLYGKKETKPFRKMGHVTILDQNLNTAIEKAKFVQKTLKVISKI